MEVETGKEGRDLRLPQKRCWGGYVVSPVQTGGVSVLWGKLRHHLLKEARGAHAWGVGAGGGDVDALFSSHPKFPGIMAQTQSVLTNA